MNIFCELSIKGVRVKELFLEKVSDDFKNLELFNIYGFFLDNNSIMLQNYCQNFDKTENLVIHLAPYVKKGNFIFTDEQDSPWGYHFDGNGRVFELEFSLKCGKALNSEMIGIANCVRKALTNEKGEAFRGLFNYYTSAQDNYYTLHKEKCDCNQNDVPCEITIFDM